MDSANQVGNMQCVPAENDKKREERMYKELTAKIDELLKDEYDLIYVDYRDELSEEQTRALVDGDWDEFYDLISAFEGDSRYEGATYEVEQLMRELESDNPELLDAIDEHRYELEEYARDIIMDRDSGEWLDQLISQASPVDCMLPLIGEDEADWGEERNPLDILKALGVAETPENVKLAEELVNEVATELGMMWAVFPMELRDLMKPYHEPVTIDEAIVCYGNPFTGGYWSVVFKGHKINTHRSEITFDGSWGYPLHEVYGTNATTYLRY